MKKKYKKPERLSAEDIRLVNEVKPLKGTRERAVYEILVGNRQIKAKKSGKN